MYRESPPEGPPERTVEKIKAFFHGQYPLLMFGPTLPAETFKNFQVTTENIPNSDEICTKFECEVALQNDCVLKIFTQIENLGKVDPPPRGYPYTNMMGLNAEFTVCEVTKF